MLSTGFLLTVALAELAALLLALCVVFGHGIWLRREQRLRTRIEGKSVTILVTALDACSLGSEDRAYLQRTPRRMQIGALMQLAPHLRGESRSQLERIAYDLDIPAYAHRCCASRFWWRRLRGARLFTMLGGGRETMLALLADPEPIVRAQAAEWAAENADPEIVNRLLFMLSDASALCRYTARDSLLRLGDSATGPTARFLFSAAPDSVEAALEVSLGLANAVLLPAAQALARNAQTARARALATRLLGAIGEAESITTLRELLRDDDAEVRMAAADSLGRIADWPSATALELLLDDVDWEVRRHAALALRDLGPPGILVLQRASRARRGHGADMARHVLDLPDLMTH